MSGIWIISVLSGIVIIYLAAKALMRYLDRNKTEE